MQNIKAYSGWRLVVAMGALALVASIATSSVPVSAQGTYNGQSLSDRELTRKRQWVKQIEARDFDFWRRYFDRLDRKGSEFPQPDSWYRPAELVEGAESAPWKRAAPSQRTISEPAWVTVRDWAMARKTGALVVVRGGVIEYEAYGEGVRPGKLLPVRSLTKTLIVLGYGIAIDRGLIGSLDDPIGRYLVEWRNDPRGRITIRQLLTFSSGLEMPLDPRFTPNSKPTRLAEGGGVNATALSYEIAYPADSGLRVNNADSQIAGLILERASGQRFSDLLSEWIWRPIGAGTATLNLDGINGDARIFCCLQSRAVDWLSIGQLFLDGGTARDGRRVLSPEYLNRMRNPSPVNNYLGLGILLGWGTDDRVPPRPNSPAFLVTPQAEPFQSPDVIYLLGGRSISLWIDPTDDLIVFRWGEDPSDWDNGFIVNTLIRGIRR